MATGFSAQNRVVVPSIVRFLLSYNRSSVPVRDAFQKLKPQLRHYGINNVEELQDFLEDYQQVFFTEANGSQIFVSVTTTLILCPEHCKTSGSCRSRFCEGLHFCKFYLLSGQCRHGDRCLFGHDLHIHHNAQLLNKHFLNNLTITDLRAVFTLPSNRHGILQPQVCRYYNVQSGCRKRHNCHSLHICRRYIKGDCKFGKKCKRNHNITNDSQVDKVLTMYGVSMQRTPREIIDELRGYTSDDGDAGQYSDDEDDQEVDEDEDYNNRSNDDNDSDDDNGAATAYRTRPPASQVQGKPPKRFGSMPNLLRKKQFSLPTDGPRHSYSALRQRYPSVGRQRERTSSGNYFSQNQSERPPLRKKEELCLYHLQGTCKFDPCMRIHSSERYEWRFSAWGDDGEDAVWRSLSCASNVVLEKSYCQPDILACSVDDVDGSSMQVNFRKFTAVNSADGLEYKVKRLSTPSAQQQDGRRGSNHHVNLATTWLWHWRTKDKTWHEFGRESARILGIHVTSAQIETMYLEDQNTQRFISSRFVLKFNNTRLKDTETDQHFKIQRRPRFTQLTLLDSPSPAQTRQAAPAYHASPVFSAASAYTGSSILPASPVHSAASNYNASPVHSAPQTGSVQKLSVKNKEYQEVEAKFRQTLGRAAAVVSIHKLENKALQAKYESKKISMAARAKKVAERELYYCPSEEENINFVQQYGIRCQLNPQQQRDATLGKGGYFFVNAAKADKLYRAASKRLLFVVNCLVGKKGQGDPHLVQPPPLNLSSPSALCDSCVDDPSNPKVFVIFDKAQVYAKYAVTFQYD